MMSQSQMNAMNYKAPSDPNSPENKRKTAMAMNAAPAVTAPADNLGS